MASPDPATADPGQNSMLNDEQLMALLQDPLDDRASEQNNPDNWMLDHDHDNIRDVNYNYMLDDVASGFDLERDQAVDFDDWLDANKDKIGSPAHVYSPMAIAGSNHVTSAHSVRRKSIGTCWRCDILRKQCDTNNPCKECSSEEPGKQWLDIGCERGTLLERSPLIDLCPSTSRDETQINDSHETEQKICDLLNNKIVDEQQSRQDNLVLTLTSPTYTIKKMQLEVYCPFIKSIDISMLASDLPESQNRILKIVWGLIEYPQVKTKVAIQSLEGLAFLLNAAANFERDIGEDRLISLALQALFDCLELLILSFRGDLSRFRHDTCCKGQCKLESIDNLAKTTKSYLEALYTVLLHAEVPRKDQRWWLSCFYSLCIQHLVRLGLMELERRLMAFFILPDSSTTQANLHCQLATDLFTIASFGSDPLSADWSLDEPPQSLLPDIKLVQHCWEARKVNWGVSAVVDSYSLLSALFNLNVSSSCSSTDNNQQEKRRRGNLESKDASQPDTALGEAHNIDKVGFNLSSDISRRRHDSPPPPLSSPCCISRSASASSRGRGEGYAMVQSLPRNISPANRASMDASRSPRGPSRYASRNRSSDSLSAFESYNRWSDVATGSPMSIYSMSPTALSPHLPLSRRTSGSFVAGRRSRLSDEITAASVTTFRENLHKCRCCPNKPKLFGTLESLNKHEAEKQHECSVCGQRFKNKNEAERHQKSLHVRRCSWSCSVIASIDRAFAESLIHQGEEDDCGYCGESFPRSGWSDNPRTKCATDVDWEQRMEHLQAVHRFQECDMAKKFFRRDHFRQHLKQFHAGTSGKWMHVLETECMVEEDPPQSRRRAELS